MQQPLDCRSRVTDAAFERIGPYELMARIGAGGMGVVYRAHDSKRNRDVALKVLPETVLTDPDRLACFQRDAQTLASLNQPQIAAIYGLEASGATRALVLELVEGPTLAERLAKQPVTVDEAFAIARQIALALEAAHERDMLHLDLKPDNIKVRDDGAVKVLGFGLAKALDPGLKADKPSDVWGFGCVLFEMLARQPAFATETAADAPGAAVRGEPNWAALPSTVPPAVRSVLKRCLQTDPSLRMRDIADARFAIDDALSAQEPAAGLSRAIRLGYIGWSVAIAFAIATAAAIAWPRRPVAADPLEARFTIATPPSDSLQSVAISPDGRSIVFAGRHGDQNVLWLRRLTDETARPLAGTDGGISPFWSPDSRTIAFFAGGNLKRIDVDSGFVRTIASAPAARHGAWGADGTILFGKSVGPLYRVSSERGEVTEATRLQSGQTNHRFPRFLADGRRFLFYTLGIAEVRGISVGSLGDQNVRRVFDRDSAYALLPPSYLLVVRQGALWARQLNLDDLSTSGDLMAIAPNAYVHSSVTGAGAVSTSNVGTIAYRPAGMKRQLLWFDRAGNSVGGLGEPDEALVSVHRLSKDGHAVTITRSINGNTDLWIIDTGRGVPRPVTFDPGTDSLGVFSPDDRQVAFVSDRRADVWEVFIRPSDGTGRETQLFESSENIETRDWSSDGRHILYSIHHEQTGDDLWAMPLEGARTPVPIARTAFAENDARFSPDSRWVAFQSNETGRHEVYVQPFPGPGPKVQVSAGGGSSPRWRHDARELYYVAPDGRLMAVSITLGDAKVDSTPPVSLFTVPKSPFGQFEPDLDGQRFLIAVDVGEPPPITVILNWKPPQRMAPAR